MMPLQRQCFKPFCLLGIGLIVAEVLIFVAYERTAASAAPSPQQVVSTREQYLEAALLNASRVAEVLRLSLQDHMASLEALRRKSASPDDARDRPLPHTAEAHAASTASGATTGSGGPVRRADPDARIQHAPWGECGGVPPRGLTQPECRWGWDEVPHPRLIVEFGGNQGDDLKHFLDRYPDATIHSFEPVSKYFRILEQEFANYTGQVVLHHIGASDADAQVAFRTDGDVAAASEFGTAMGAARPVYEEVMLRDAHALLSQIVLTERRSIDVLSINCEGCEYAILERLSATGWFDRLRYLQVSWHTSSQIPRRLDRRCNIMKELRKRLRPAYHADFAWEGYSAIARPYAVDVRFLGDAAVADVARGNGIGQAQSNIACPIGTGEPPPGARELHWELDPDSGHLTYPQTMRGDLTVHVLLGQALAIPTGLEGLPPLIVEVGAGAGVGVRFQHVLARNPSARVHSFEPVAALRQRLQRETARRNLTTGGRVVWGQGLASADGWRDFRVWAGEAGEPGEPAASHWAGHIERAELWDADRALSAVRRQERRLPDLLYLNCEGCEYEVLERLASVGWIASLPRLAISWHGGGAPWQQRCALDARLRRTHRLERSACSFEVWVLSTLPS